MYKLANTVQHYKWGSLTEIPELLNIENPKKKPFAELWMGTHKKAVSTVTTDKGEIPLDKLIEKNLEMMVGGVNKKLPFLMKILAAAKPLSIQLHPDKKSAKEGFARENKTGIPLNATHRTYKDNNHKPEILCALKPFTALKGFRPYNEIIQLFAPISSKILKKELIIFKNSLNENGLKRFFSFILNLNEEEIKGLIKSIKKTEKNNHNGPYTLCLDLVEEYGYDVGIFSPLFLNILNLKSGEAIFIRAGELHAYIKGTGIELMASSDNVIRGGLTTKYIDKDELLKLTDFSESKATKVDIKKELNGEEIYITEADDFKLSRIRVNNEKPFHSLNEESANIIICIEGNLSIINPQNNVRLRISKGESVFIPAYINEFYIEGKGLLFKAT